MNSTATPTTFSDLSRKASHLLDSSTPRCLALQLGASVGKLCGKLSTAPLDPVRTQETTNIQPTCENEPFWSTPSSEREDIYKAIGDIFLSLCIFANRCGIDLRESILKKMQLNARKYPVHLCKGKSGKYTEYSQHTGIDRDNQSTLDISIEDEDTSSDQNCSESPKSIVTSATNTIETVPELMKKIRDFAIERNWSRFHTPRNICLAMMGETGELAELFQWMGDDTRVVEKFHGLASYGWKEEDIDHVQQELADVSIYALRLADVVGIQDLGLYALSSSK
jgi:dCTP diphosphatase